LPRSLRKASVILRVARQGSSESTAEQNREVIFLGEDREGQRHENKRSRRTKWTKRSRRTNRTNPSMEAVLSDQAGEWLDSWGRPRFSVRYSAATWQQKWGQDIGFKGAGSLQSITRVWVQ
jgi:hypothetical protein